MKIKAKDGILVSVVYSSGVAELVAYFVDEDDAASFMVTKMKAEQKKRNNIAAYAMSGVKSGLLYIENVKREPKSDA